VFVDGKELGVTPGPFKVNVCAKEVEVKHKEHGTWKQSLSVQAQEVRKLKAVISAEDSEGTGRFVTRTQTIVVGGGCAHAQTRRDTTVKDSKTGLTWQGDFAKDKKWKEAIDYCKSLSYAGFSDWRLPNKDELSSLLNKKRKKPASDFPAMPSSSFWTRKSASDVWANSSWIINFVWGTVGPHYILRGRSFVRCVR